MKKHNGLKILAAIILIILILSIAAVKIYGPNFGIYLTPPSTKEYVNSALKLMNNGIYAKGEAWQKAKADALEKAKSAETYKDTYDILNEAAKVAGGKHSAIVNQERQQKTIEAQQLPECKTIGDILYIKLPPYDMGSQKSQEYTDTVISFLKKNADKEKVIVDLRNNTGGDMGPMLAALSPLLPDGKLMSFDIWGNLTKVELKNGTVSGGGSLTTVEAFKLSDPKIAILQNEWTGSSGEATLLSFKGLPDVKSFGSASAGYCSVNNLYTLYDGAYMQLTIGKDVDRLGQSYCEDPIAPDFLTEEPLEAAIDWLNGK